MKWGDDPHKCLISAVQSISTRAHVAICSRPCWCPDPISLYPLISMCAAAPRVSLPWALLAARGCFPRTCSLPTRRAAELTTTPPPGNCWPVSDGSGCVGPPGPPPLRWGNSWVLRCPSAHLPPPPTLPTSSVALNSSHPGNSLNFPRPLPSPRSSPPKDLSQILGSLPNQLLVHKHFLRICFWEVQIRTHFKPSQSVF